jgi:hypothetical protein
MIYFDNFLKPSEVDELTLREIVDLINVLSDKECLVYMNSTWNLVLNWFKSILFKNSTNEIDSERLKFLTNYIENEFENYYNSNDLNEFLIKNNSLKLSKLILMLSDVSVETILNKISIQLNDRLYSANKYVYMPSQKVDKCLIILNNLMKLVKSILSIIYFIFFLSCFILRFKIFLKIKSILSIP